VETQNGLIALGAVHKGTVDDIDPNFINDNPVWSTVVFPRFVGIVTHWNFQKCYGFISCDSIRPQVFLQKKEFLIPYEVTSDPYQAIIMSPKAHDRVTFDTIETPRGIRALGVKKWKGE
jgi:cold shock CspA family protein